MAFSHKVLSTSNEHFEHFGMCLRNIKAIFNKLANPHGGETLELTQKKIDIPN